MSHRTWVATLDDGSQVLIELDDNELTIAQRDRPSYMWGPPITAEEK